MNNIVLIGRLTRDVEVRSTASGARVANFTLAVSRRFKGADGVEVDFIDCVAWNKPVDVLEAYTKKGHQLGVQGRLQTRHYENSEGRRVNVTEVIVENVDLIEPKGNDETKEQRVAIPHVPDVNDPIKSEAFGDDWSKPQNDGLNIAAYGERRNPNPTIDDFLHSEVDF